MRMMVLGMAPSSTSNFATPSSPQMPMTLNSEDMDGRFERHSRWWRRQTPSLTSSRSKMPSSRQSHKCWQHWFGQHRWVDDPVSCRPIQTTWTMVEEADGPIVNFLKIRNAINPTNANDINLDDMDTTNMNLDVDIPLINILKITTPLSMSSRSQHCHQIPQDPQRHQSHKCLWHQFGWHGHNQHEPGCGQPCHQHPQDHHTIINVLKITMLSSTSSKSPHHHQHPPLQHHHPHKCWQHWIRMTWMANSNDTEDGGGGRPHHWLPQDLQCRQAVNLTNADNIDLDNTDEWTTLSAAGQFRLHGQGWRRQMAPLSTSSRSAMPSIPQMPMTSIWMTWTQPTWTWMWTTLSSTSSRSPHHNQCPQDHNAVINILKITTQSSTTSRSAMPSIPQMPMTSIWMTRTQPTWTWMWTTLSSTSSWSPHHHQCPQDYDAVINILKITTLSSMSSRLRRCHQHPSRSPHNHQLPQDPQCHQSHKCLWHQFGWHGHNQHEPGCGQPCHQHPQDLHTIINVLQDHNAVINILKITTQSSTSSRSAMPSIPQMPMTSIWMTWTQPTWTWMWTTLSSTSSWSPHRHQCPQDYDAVINILKITTLSSMSSRLRRCHQHPQDHHTVIDFLNIRNAINPTNINNIDLILTKY